MHQGIKRQLLCLPCFSSVSRKRFNPSSSQQHFHNCCLQDCPLTKPFCKDQLLPFTFHSIPAWSFHKSCWKRFTHHTKEQHSCKNSGVVFFLTSAHLWRSETWHCHSISQRHGCPSLGVPSGPGFSVSCCQATFTTDLPSSSPFLWSKRKTSAEAQSCLIPEPLCAS